MIVLTKAQIIKLHEQLIRETGGSPACFEYTEEDAHVGVGPCYHCKCVQCGKLIHLHCEEIRELQTHLLEHHGFRMSTVRTVFYGLCETCDRAE